MQKIIFLTCFVLEITRGGGNFYPPPPPAPPPNHLTSIKKPNQNRVNEEYIIYLSANEIIIKYVIIAVI